MRVYMAVVAVIALAFGLGLIASGWTLGSPVAVAALIVIALFSERGPVRLRGGLHISISLFPSIFAATLLGPLAGMAVFGASAIPLRIPIAGRLTYLCHRLIIGGVAGAAAAVAAALFNGGTGEVV